MGGGLLFDSTWGTATIPIQALDPSAPSGLDIRVSISRGKRREAVDAVLLSGYGLSPESPKRK